MGVEVEVGLEVRSSKKVRRGGKRRAGCPGLRLANSTNGPGPTPIWGDYFRGQELHLSPLTLSPSKN